jgi:hypothetical protein
MGTRPLVTTFSAAVLAVAVLLPSDADAAWTALPLWNNTLKQTVSSARVCKTMVNSPYGALWRVNYQVFRIEDRVKRITTYAIRYPAKTFLNIESNEQWLYGVVSGTGGNVYASVFFDDRFDFQVDYTRPIWDSQFGSWIGGSGIASLKPSEIANC